VGVSLVFLSLLVPTLVIIVCICAVNTNGPPNISKCYVNVSVRMHVSVYNIVYYVCVHDVTRCLCMHKFQIYNGVRAKRWESLLRKGGMSIIRY
jgi:hypothetical protein